MQDADRSSEKSDSSTTVRAGAVAVERFEDLPIESVVHRGIEALGFERPTPIQQRAIVPLVEGRDFIGLAPTGTGKTLAYGIPLAHRLIAEPPPMMRRPRRHKGGDPGGKYVDPKRRLRGLVVVPTRELAQQVAEELRRLTRGSLVKATAVWGKAALKPQRDRIEAGVDILVGTPGRLRELMDIDVLSLAFIRHLVVDEGDRMLDLGFRPQLRTILERMPENRQMAFFSATMPPAMEDLARTFLREPVRVEAGRHTRAAEHLGNRLFEIEDVLKVALLLQLVVAEKRRGVLIFCRTRRRAGWVHAALRHHGMSVGLVHGDRSQKQRNRALDLFADGASGVLVATDVAARGLHIDAVRTVVNYDLPLSAEEWVHRVGRAGHGGGFGESFTFVSPPEKARWKIISKIVGERIKAESLPDIEAFVRPQDAAKLEKYRSGRKATRLEPFREKAAGGRKSGGRPRTEDASTKKSRPSGGKDRAMLATELDEWGIELSADEIEGFDEVERVGGEAAVRKPRKDRAGSGRGAKDAIGKS
ncbi:MAG: DEAD/DEAH box helicase, partial [Planctomycetota bacterium]|nr:DEAD/DEAH box helicase [Planctomycetota bacterium]